MKKIRMANKNTKLLPSGSTGKIPYRPYTKANRTKEVYTDWMSSKIMILAIYDILDKLISLIVSLILVCFSTIMVWIINLADNDMTCGIKTAIKYGIITV
jgi:hypothetical protein